MNYFTTALLRNLLTNENNLPEFEKVLTELFRSELEKSLNEILEYELTTFLEYEKYERSDNDNSRNGSYKRDFHTKFGTLNIKIPRDRLSQFSSPLFPKYKRHDNATEETIMQLYDAVMTTREISETVKNIYGKQYSRQTVSNITDKIIASIDSFKSRKLYAEYAVVYLDATCIALRRDTVAKEAVHIAIGIRVDGTKEILGYVIAPNESAEIWKELLIDLKKRGVERISLICTDGLAGVENVIEEQFAASKIQRCIVHVSRNIYAKARVKDKPEIVSDFKDVYTSKTLQDAQNQLNAFNEKWKTKYPKIIESLLGNHHLFTFYEFPKEVRSSIYTTNLIEGFNKLLKKKVKQKEQFCTEESMEKFLVSQFEKYNEKYMNRVHRGFGQTTREQWFKD